MVIKSNDLDDKNYLISGKLVTWASGIASALLVAAILGITSWLTSMYVEIRSHGERIAVLEAQMIHVTHKLETIDTKLDRLLDMERQHRTGRP